MSDSSEQDRSDTRRETKTDRTENNQREKHAKPPKN
jgi:hypothetical protein